MTVVFVDRRVGKGTRSMMRRGRVKANPDDVSPGVLWPTVPASPLCDAAWPDWKIGPRPASRRCGVVDLYTARMVRTGALPPRPGVGPPRQRPGGLGRPVVKVGRGTVRHEAAKRAGPRPMYRRLRVGGPLWPASTRLSRWRWTRVSSVVAQEGWLAATLTLVIVLVSAASATFI